MSNSTVFANGQGISSAASGAQSIGGPDVCLDASGVPVPFPNIAQSTTIADGTKTIKVDGGMGGVKDCNYSRSSGDEAGVNKGVGSATMADKAEPANCAFDVKFEGQGALRNTDPMTHNNKNTIGVNQDSAAGPPATEIQPEEVDPGTLRLKVVEHLSWDAFLEDKKSFLLGHRDNKPIAGMKFKITLPSGSVVEKTTDADGVIEITGLEPGGKCDVEFQPEEAKLNNSYHLFYDRITSIEPE